MSHLVTVELNDTTYQALQQQARAAEKSPADLAAATLEKCFPGTGANGHASEADKQAARERFERHFGEIDLGQPTGIDNETIDADLARSYADTHEEP
ncbi:MAG: hypothetical protein U0793_00665 [Gemmataceae bacterium]